MRTGTNLLPTSSVYLASAEEREEPMVVRTGTRLLVSLTMTAALIIGSAGFANAAVVVKATTAHRWNPASTSISRGTKVVWKNPTGVKHTVTSYGSNWSKNTTISPNGGHTAFTFQASGTFKFRCRFHSTLSNGVCSGMCGVIKVS
jgi:plastocyanin